MKRLILVISICFFQAPFCFSQQNAAPLGFLSENPFFLKNINTIYGNCKFPPGTPLFSFLLDSLYTAAISDSRSQADTTWFTFAGSIKVKVQVVPDFSPGIKLTLIFTNEGKGNHKIENLVPFGENIRNVYITASGSKEWPGYLCRSKLFLPGRGAVGVLLPDNAWHLGFSDLRLNDSVSVTALARRVNRDKERTTIDRWAVTLKPGGWVEYAMYIDCHAGDWHEGLRMMFRDRWLYDLPQFDNTLFHRSDLQWMKGTYLMLLQFAWDKKYYDHEKQKHTFYESLFEYDSLTGGYDIFTLWPTWPRLGLDQRNQWDMYRDLPGGLDELRRQSDFCHKAGKRYFISYNPWDEGTRKEDHLRGMEELLRITDADGVVLDTRGESSRELQATADRVKPGIIMYSEGMAVPKDMPGIVSGRVHDALVLPPPINMNKFIKPEFAIFRVLQLADDRLHRELCISFFNGYGLEINTMRPGRPEWMEEEYRFMGKTTRLLREFSDIFTNGSQYPLFPSMVDSIYINRWSDQYRTLYTIYSVNPSGNQGKLFEITDLGGMSPDTFLKKYRITDLWNHEEVKTDIHNGKIEISLPIDAFDRSWLNSRREGAAGCAGVFQKLLSVNLDDRFLTMESSKGTRIVLTAGNPSYASRHFEFPITKNRVDYRKVFGKIPEKMVIRLFNGTALIDEVVVHRNPGLPVKITVIEKTALSASAPEGMVRIPSGKFSFYTKRDPGTLEPFIPLPDHSDTTEVVMPQFFMDRYPVTNAGYYRFLTETNYRPADTANFLKHWINGKPATGTDNFPVVFISMDDAAAYAKWAGKRLPSEMEWQYAAQGTDFRKFPWGNEMDSTRCNYKLNHPVEVTGFPSGASPFGVEDMVGNVWQMMQEKYDNGSYYYGIIRGGSYYHPDQSIWYVTGGPLPADHPELLLLVSPSLDRNATVGFRCVKDAVQP